MEMTGSTPNRILGSPSTQQSAPTQLHTQIPASFAGPHLPASELSPHPHTYLCCPNRPPHQHQPKVAQMLPEETSELNTLARVGAESFTEGSIVNLYIYEPGSSVEGEKYLALLRFHYYGSDTAQNDYINGFIAYLHDRIGLDGGDGGSYLDYQAQHAGTPQEGVGERVLGCDLRGMFPRGGSSTWDPALQQIRLAVDRTAPQTSSEGPAAARS